MIGVVIRELTFLKVLHPIVEELIKIGVPYVIYHFDAPRGDKEYNRATLSALKKSSPEIIEKAHKVKPFPNDPHLKKQLLHDKISKLVSLEVYLWAKSYIDDLRKQGIKIYNILYLTDSLWVNDPRNITTSNKVYYSSEYLMNLHLNMLNVKKDKSRDKWLGSPIYDPIKPYEYKTPNGILVLLPNLKKEHVGVAFGSKDNFIKIMDNICKTDTHNLIFKTRKKQWMPKELQKYGATIISDGDKMYPPSIIDAFAKCHCVVMFYSSGVYECMYSGKYVVNIELPLKRWPHDKQKMAEYFKGPVYNLKGAVESIDQKTASAPDFRVKVKLNGLAQEDWLSNYVGLAPANSSKMIVRDIVGD